jgi:hypothetical protein
MWPPPIMERELRIAMRKRGALKSRLRMAFFGAGAVCVFMFLNWGLDAGLSGSTLHKILLAVQFAKHVAWACERDQFSQRFSR